MKMKRLKNQLLFIALSLIAGVGLNPAQAVPLPACNQPINCLVFDDFTVYSLELLNLIDGSTAFDVDSSPGQLRTDNAIVIGTGAGGLFQNTANIDEPYDTPNNAGPGSFGDFANYESISLADPNPNFPANGDNTVNTDVGGATVVGGNMWDATTAALRSFVDPGEAVVFYFNLNETNQGGDNVLNQGQDMFGWMQVTLTDLDGVLADQVFTLSGSGALPGGSAVQTAGVDDILPTANDLWAHVHGEICVDPTDTANPFRHFGECTAGDPAAWQDVNQNLGANQAAFALYNETLSDLILSSDYDLVSVDLRMSHIDNGYEQLFILPGTVGITIAEPATLGMIGLGLIGLGFAARRRINL